MKLAAFLPEVCRQEHLRMRQTCRQKSAKKRKTLPGNWQEPARICQNRQNSARGTPQKPSKNSLITPSCARDGGAVCGQVGDRIFIPLPAAKNFWSARTKSNFFSRAGLASREVLAKTNRRGARGGADATRLPAARLACCEREHRAGWQHATEPSIRLCQVAKPTAYRRARRRAALAAMLSAVTAMRSRCRSSSTRAFALLARVTRLTSKSVTSSNTRISRS